MDIPDPIIRRIGEIANARNYDYNELLDRYKEILTDGTLSEITFNTEEEKFDIALKVLISETLDSVPVKKMDVLPIGYSGIRKTKKGDMMRSLYVIVPKPKPRIVRVSCMGKHANIIDNLQLFNKYTVRIGEFSDGSLTVTNRTRFTDPEPVLNDMSYSTIDKLMQKIGVKRITLAEAKNHKSRVRSDGFVDDTDWRVVRGYIIREYTGDRNDGTKFGIYTIIDNTIPLEDKVLPDGRVIPPGFTVWVPPEMMRWEGECDFYGSIDITDDGEAQMNAFLVVGVHAKVKDRGDE